MKYLTRQISRYVGHSDKLCEREVGRRLSSSLISILENIIYFFHERRDINLLLL